MTSTTGCIFKLFQVIRYWCGGVDSTSRPNIADLNLLVSYYNWSTNSTFYQHVSHLCNLLWTWPKTPQRFPVPKHRLGRRRMLQPYMWQSLWRWQLWMRKGWEGNNGKGTNLQLLWPNKPMCGSHRCFEKPTKNLQLASTSLLWKVDHFDGNLGLLRLLQGCFFEVVIFKVSALSFASFRLTQGPLSWES